jgi:hypothetical protein
MTIYAIILDIRNQATLKAEVQGAIKGLSGNWAMPFENVWLVYGDGLTEGQIYSRLRGLLHLEEGGSDNDRILISELGAGRAGWLPNKVWDWMHTGEELRD